MTSRYLVGMASSKDVKAVSANLREADYKEVQATVGFNVTVSAAIRFCWLVSRDTTFVCTVDTKPAAIFGLRLPSAIGTAAIPWLLSTPLLYENPKEFLRGSYEIMKLWSSQFSVLRNYVDARNAEAVRWLQWLGFDVYYPKPFGALRMPFHKFEMRA